MTLINYLLAAINEMRQTDSLVTPATSISQLPDIGIDEIDFLLAEIALEIEFRVHIPDDWSERKDWTITDFANAADALPKVADPLWAHDRLKILASLYQDLLPPAATVKAILDQQN